VNIREPEPLPHKIFSREFIYLKVNTKEINIPGMGGDGIKENDGGDDFNYYIL
jgi:hypothetical protein